MIRFMHLKLVFLLLLFPTILIGLMPDAGDSRAFDAHLGEPKNLTSEGPSLQDRPVGSTKGHHCSRIFLPDPLASDSPTMKKLD